MSEAPEKESKTEEATPQKLAKAAEKGDVVRTMDLGPFAVLAAVSSVLIMCGGWMARDMASKLLPFFAHPDAMSLEGHGGMQVLRYTLLAGAPAFLIVMLSAAAAGAAASVAQSGFSFNAEKLKPDFSKLSPKKGLERMFGPDGVVQFLKSLVKVSIIALLVWWVLKPYVPKFSSLSALDVGALLPFSIEILKRLVYSVIGLSLVVAGGDWMWQRHRFMIRQRMTKEEVKEDYKNSEGDPHIKARQRQLRMEKARRRMMQAVPEATVVVMNPTHYAVALKYEQGENAAPMCVAKGMDAVALRIRAIAEEAGVHVIEDPPLARALYASVDIDEMIPPAHFEAVAKIIGFILGAGRRRAAHR
ncbi:MAG: flagellar biosynthesis protein FlhB [Alphaproteobacteria bacterium]|nr:flagellar biosynthesis protein FlhB [Alphaproteobacteria bacterium]MBU1515786.1 flagellar biosynthesis protein FlhB [Alphaproteobacteria bacterium]MBU2094008.1 flagellar biosynthesis protein FlhB [Alphaproteobacteria bacterium]MBU2153418.1 flagellar biosynthesis protein FlhB [Alphaproteobacteria bacterium]MBU2308846.1 flagellar biosynthesis protein FlhB [Alphaproteobacteria bacterium]